MTTGRIEHARESDDEGAIAVARDFVTTTPERARREALEAGLDEHQAAEVEALVANLCDELGCS